MKIIIFYFGNFPHPTMSGKHNPTMTGKLRPAIDNPRPTGEGRVRAK